MTEAELVRFIFDAEARADAADRARAAASKIAFDIYAPTLDEAVSEERHAAATRMVASFETIANILEGYRAVASVDAVAGLFDQLGRLVEAASLSGELLAAPAGVAARKMRSAKNSSSASEIAAVVDVYLRENKLRAMDSDKFAERIRGPLSEIVGRPLTISKVRQALRAVKAASSGGLLAN
jgi:hypothetical protein